MNIDLILTEWCFRLPKGYPTNPKDYEILYDVLVETSDVSIDEARQIVDRAKGTISSFVTESLKFDSILQNQFLVKAIQEANKVEELTKFLSLLPVEGDMLASKFLNNLTYDESKQFASILYSEDTINESLLNRIDFKTGIIGKLFNLNKPGLGRGELLMAALIKDSFVNGGSSSYDLNVNNKKFEIKDYSNPKKPSASIRLGTKGTVTRFRFWDEITATFQRISQLRGIDSPKFDLDKLLPESLLEAIRYLDTRREFILAGNLNLKDKSYLDLFYQEANKLASDIKGYTNVILRGPNATPIEMSIEPITDAAGDAFVIRPIKDNSQSLTYINAELRRLKYVRNPREIDQDMQAAVNTIIDDVTFIVFRRDRINVTQDFRYVVTDAGKIRIIEKDIIPDDTEETDAVIEEQY